MQLKFLSPQVLVPAAALLAVAAVAQAQITPATSMMAQLTTRSSIHCQVSVAAGPNMQTGSNATDYDVSCYTPEGSELRQVPTGKYLVITDFLVTPTVLLNATDKTEKILFKVGYDMYSKVGFLGGVTVLRNTDDGFSEHFRTPFVIVPAGKRLQLINLGFNYTRAYMFYATGVLTPDPNER